MTEFNPQNGDPILPHPENMTSPEQRCIDHSWGHTMHFIRARLCREGGDRVPARILKVDGHYIEFATDAGTFRRWNHSPFELQKKTDFALIDPELPVLWSPKYRMLTIEHPRFRDLIGLDEGDVTPCHFI